MRTPRGQFEEFKPCGAMGVGGRYGVPSCMLHMHGYIWPHTPHTLNLNFQDLANLALSQAASAFCQTQLHEALTLVSAL